MDGGFCEITGFSIGIVGEKNEKRTIAVALIGGEQVSPCPCCGTTGSRLGVLDHVGMCYGCGKVSLARLFTTIYRADHHGKGAAGQAPPQGAAKHHYR